MTARTSLQPQHLEDLRASGIDESLASEADIRSISHDEAYTLGFRSMRQLDGLLIPYLEPMSGGASNRYARLKLTTVADGVKYLCPQGERPRFYFTPGTTPAHLQDSTLAIFVVEGEKKALAVLAWARRRRIRCLVIGIGGCYGWLRSEKGELPDGGLGKIGSRPIEDFDLINWLSRKVTLCLDGDVQTNPDIMAAESRLARELIKRGSQVSAVRIPPGRDGKRRGADDVLVQEGDAAWEVIMAAAVTKQNPDAEVSDLLRDSGLEALDELSTLEKIEAALTNLRMSLKGVDPLRRALAREGAVRVLARLGLKAPTAAVDAAIGTDEQSEMKDRQGSPLVLSNTEPWPESVNGANLLNELRSTFTTYLALPPGGSELLPLWTVHCHAHDASEVSPILGAKSATKRAGKTTTFTLLGALTPRPLVASNVTSAVVFRAVDKFSPTLLVDEADSFLSTNEELRGILNSGHTRAGATVVRTIGDEHEPRCFSTWGPKAIALIGSLPGTLEDRSILLPMRRRSTKEKVQRLRLDRLRSFEPLRRKIARWVKDNVESLRHADPLVPEELNDRAADNWRPLFAIADLCGGTWPEEARRAARILSGSADEGDNTPGIQLLADLQAMFAESGEDRLPSKEIVQTLIGMEDRPWPEWRKGKPLTETQLARILKPFGVRPKGIRLKDGTTPRGYLLADLEDAFARYVPSEVQHPQQVNDDNNLQADSKCNTDPPVAPAQTDEKQRQMGIVADVAPPKGKPPAVDKADARFAEAVPEVWEEI